jgi:cytidylate kinase
LEPYVITVSRQFASLGRTIASQLAENLNIEFYDRDIVEETAKRMNLPISLISESEEQVRNGFFKRKYPRGMENANLQDEIFMVQTNIIKDVVKKESCIIVGRCGYYLLKDHPRSLHVYIYAPYEERLRNCIDVLKMNEKIARRMIHDVDKAREVYMRSYCKASYSIFDSFDIMIDSSRFGVKGTASIIKEIEI